MAHLRNRFDTIYNASYQGDAETVQRLILALEASEVNKLMDYLHIDLNNPEMAETIFKQYISLHHDELRLNQGDPLVQGGK